MQKRLWTNPYQPAMISWEKIRSSCFTSSACYVGYISSLSHICIYILSCTTVYNWLALSREGSFILIITEKLHSLIPYEQSLRSIIIEVNNGQPDQSLLCLIFQGIGRDVPRSQRGPPYWEIPMIYISPKKSWVSIYGLNVPESESHP